MQHHSKAADQKLLQELNRIVVLNEIVEAKQISRSQVAKRTKLSPSTVSIIVEAFINEGIVIEVGDGDSTKAGGRKPRLLRINEKGACIVTAAVSAESRGILVQFVVFDLGFTPIDERELVVDRSGEELIRWMENELRSIVDRQEGRRVLGIGVSISAIVGNDGVVYRGHLLDLDEFPLADHLRRAFPRLPVVLEEDTSAAILGEHTIGSNTTYQNLIYVMVGRGIGASAILSNRLIKGAKGGAGVIGHMSINKFGEMCTCGKRGCLRLYATELMFMKKIREAVRDGRPVPSSVFDPKTEQVYPREVYQEAVKGEPYCTGLLTTLLDDLAIGLSNLVHLFNPERILIGGNLLSAQNVVIPYLNTKMAEYTDSPPTSVEVVASKLGKDAPIYGVASIVYNDHFLKKGLLLKTKRSNRVS